MAKKFIDVTVNDEKDAYTKGDGTALTLTNSVRVLYDDTLESAELYTILTRVRDAMLQGNVPDA